MRNRITSFILLLLLCHLSLLGNVRSTSGTIKFDRNSDGSGEMVLNSNGLSIGHSNPSANLHVSGNAYIENLILGNSLEWERTTIATNTVLSESFNSPVLFVDSSADNITLTLPYAGNLNGSTLWIKKKSRLNLLTIQTTSGNIDGATKLFLGGSSKNLPNVQLISEGGDWWILQSDYWSPKSLATLSGWYDASDLETITLESGNVNKWEDKSGHNYDVIQTTTTAQPVFETDKVVFDGTDDRLGRSGMDLANFLGGDRYTGCVAIVLKRLSGTVYLKINSGGERFGGENASRFDFGDISSGANNLNGWSASLSTTDYDILILEKQREAQVVTLNGVEVDSNSNDGPMTESVGAISFSLGANYSGAFPANVEIKEVICLTNANSTERKKLEGYLAWKWNLISQLPSEHPYLLSPP